MWLCSDVLGVTNAMRGWKADTDREHLDCHRMAKSPTDCLFNVAVAVVGLMLHFIEI